MKNNVHYEARLNRNISRSPYGSRTTYKKGTTIWDCSEEQFKKLTSNNIEDHTDMCLCEGHGVYEYFDLEKDIEFVRVEVKTIKNERIVKLKK